MKVVTIKGRKLPLRFDMGAWSEISEKVCPFSELENRLKDEKTRIKTVIGLTMVMANSALEYLGQPADVTEAFIRSASPRTLTELLTSVQLVIADSMQMELSEEKEQEERDLVLEEIQKKTI